MKSTQDLVRFMQALSIAANAQTPVMIYPDKSFVVYQEAPATGELEIIYSSSDVGDGLDINDLAYENATNFLLRIEQIEEARALIEEEILTKGQRDKFSDL